MNSPGTATVTKQEGGATRRTIHCPAAAAASILMGCSFHAHTIPFKAAARARGRVKEETAASLDSVDLPLPTAPNGRRAVEVEAAPSEPLYAYLALSKTSAVC